jgi:hypothetical protein
MAESCIGGQHHPLTILSPSGQQAVEARKGLAADTPGVAGGGCRVVGACAIGTARGQGGIDIDAAEVACLAVGSRLWARRDLYGSLGVSWRRKPQLTSLDKKKPAYPLPCVPR